MKILAIETSCDETAIAIAEFDGRKQRPHIRVLSNLVSSQVRLHAKFGGVVPNLAKREHQKNLSLILLQALKNGEFSISKSEFPRLRRPARARRAGGGFGGQVISKQSQNLKIKKIDKILEREPELLKRFKKNIMPLKPPPIDAIAVTHGPGLAPALWVGVNFAKALAYLWKKPLIPVNHMAGHLYSAFLQKSGVDSKLEIRNSKFPAIALLVSGGHTELVLIRGHGRYKIIGETLDDAAGEAFDKVARILGLGYPGGPIISKLAEKGSPGAIKFPRPMMNTKDFNMSFSGLKTSVLYYLRDHTKINKADVAANFQQAVVDVLTSKTIRALKRYKAKTLLLGGGVAANKKLRHTLKEKTPRTIKFLPSDLSLTGDNALMIALAAHFQWASLAPRRRAAYFSGTKKAWNTVHADANVKLS